MQIASNPNTSLSMHLFARSGGQNYMMRSEKRPGYYGSSKKRGRRPRRRRPVYAFFTLLFSVLIWPVGMFMLWARKLRWGISVKCLVSLLTLVAFCGWIYAGLTMPTEDATLQKVQAGAQTALTNTVDAIVDAGDLVAEKSTDVWSDVVAFNTEIGEYSKEMIVTGIESSSEFTSEAKIVVSDSIKSISERVSAVFDSSDDEEPEESAAPAETSVASVLPTVTAKPTATIRPTVSPKATVSASTPDVTISASPAISSSVQPDAEPSASAAPDVTARITASASPEATNVLESAKPTKVSTIVPTAFSTPANIVASTETATSSPTVSPKPSAKPTSVYVTETPVATPLPTLKPAGDAIVYHTSSGRSYHLAENCIGMSGAKPYTLAESIADGYGSCGNCFPPKPDIIDAENIVWCDEANRFHVSDECADFTGRWTLLTIEDALEQEYTACETCGAAGYLEPAVSPSPEASIEPAATPSVTLKPAAEATVYHSTNGRWYHSQENCQSMYGADPDSLENSLALGLMWCRRCEPPKAELLGKDVLWSDEEGTCHTTDECGSFIGKYSLLLLEDASEDDLSACAACHADEHLSGAPVVEATAEASPTAGATPISASLSDSKLRALAEETIVHYSSISKFYHKNSTCTGMSISDEHTLAEALDAGLRRCLTCNPPALEDLTGND